MTAGPTGSQHRVQFLHRPYIDSVGVFSDAIVGVIAAIAKQERIRMSERVKAGIAKKKAKGETWKRGRNRKYKGGKPSRVTLWRHEREQRTGGF